MEPGSTASQALTQPRPGVASLCCTSTTISAVALRSEKSTPGIVEDKSSKALFCNFICMTCSHWGIDARISTMLMGGCHRGILGATWGCCFTTRPEGLAVSCLGLQRARGISQSSQNQQEIERYGRPLYITRRSPRKHRPSGSADRNAAGGAGYLCH